MIGHQLEATAEYQRLANDYDAWLRWGPYLAERAWGTVREDYSADGAAWHYFPHDHARSRVYRWNEDGLAGISDDEGLLCFALALWNGQDPFLKERLFGLSNPEGNHGEDVKEVYFYLDSTPTHSYMKMLYRYPQLPFPYHYLLEENLRRTKQDPEFELPDTGIFDENRYFDVLVEYAKATPDDILIRIGATNRGPDPAALHLLPTLWFRNTWAWEYESERPVLYQVPSPWPEVSVVEAHHWVPQLPPHEWELGAYALYCENPDTLLFTENETNQARIYEVPNATPFVKDAFHRYIVNGEKGSVNPAHTGTKMAAYYKRTVAPGDTATIRLRLSALTSVKTKPRSPMTPTTSPPSAKPPPLPAVGSQQRSSPVPPFTSFEALFTERQQEADAYYAALQSWQSTVKNQSLREELQRIQRQAWGACYGVSNSITTLFHAG